MIVGFIGLGTMGGPMALNVLKKGHGLIVADTRAAAVSALVAAGATSAATPGEVAAVAGTLTLMIGGAADVITRVRPVLDCMGTDLFHCGELGAGQTMKLINNLLATSIMEASIEALVTGTKSGLTFDTMI